VDLFNGALLMYMVLIVFAFPFLNSYLFGFLRFGMWWVFAPGGGKEDAKEMHLFEWVARTILQFLVMTLSQILGAFAASRVVKKSAELWPGAMYHSSSDAVGEETAIGFSYKPPASVDIGWLFLDEFFAVLILLVGLLHLIHKHLPALLINTYWKPPIPTSSGEAINPSVGFKDDITSMATVLNGVSEKVGEIGGMLQNLNGVSDKVGGIDVMLRKLNGVGALAADDINETLHGKIGTVTKTIDDSGITLPVSPILPRFGQIPKIPLIPMPRREFASSFSSPRLDTGSFFLRSEADALLPAAPPTKPWTPSASAEFPPVPAELVLHASLLVAAVSRAFPSAHQSLHLSVYFWYMGFYGEDFNQIGYRVLGGYVACGAALMYYWFWFVIAGRISGDADTEKGDQKSWPRRNFLDVAPAMFRAELRLPNYTRLKPAV
jgi:hypothetical protein